MRRLKQYPSILFGTVLVFIFIFWYFSVISPIFPFDSDDWTIMNDTAPVLPLIHGWVPARVFQNFFVSMVGDFGALVLRPLFGLDYVVSIGVSCALFLALFSCLLFAALFRLFAALSGRRGLALFMGLSVFSMFFGLFKGSRNMLYSYDFTCYIVYGMPDLLNCALVCELMRRHVKYGRLSMGTGLQSGLMFCWMYFSMFSLLFSASVSAVFVLVYCLWMWCKLPKDTFANKIKAFAKKLYENPAAIILPALYAASAIIEITGKRARWSHTSQDIFENTLRSIGNFIGQIWQEGSLLTLLFIFILLCIGLGIYLSYRRQDHDAPVVHLGKICALSLPVLLIAFSVIGAKAGMAYSLRRDVFFGLGFFIILLTALAGLYILQRWKNAAVALPLAGILLFSSMFPLHCDVSQYNASRIPYAQSLAISQYIVREVIAADKAGKTQCTIRVPDYGTQDNWPLVSTYTAGQAMDVLYRHRIISRPIAVTFLPDARLNDMLQAADG